MGDAITRKTQPMKGRWRGKVKFGKEWVSDAALWPHLRLLTPLNHPKLIRLIRKTMWTAPVSREQFLNLCLHNGLLRQWNQHSKQCHCQGNWDFILVIVAAVTDLAQLADGSKTTSWFQSAVNDIVGYIHGIFEKVLMTERIDNGNTFDGVEFLPQTHKRRETYS